MARLGDVGPYAVGNVKIVTNGENRAEQRTTDEARKKLSAAHKGNTYSLGRKAGPEELLKRSVAHRGNKSRKGQTRSEEERRKTSEAIRRNWERRRQLYGPTGRAL